MIYTVKCLTHVQQNHSREFLLIHASQNGICGADKCRFCGIKFLISIFFAERRLFVVKYAVSWFNAFLRILTLCCLGVSVASTIYCIVWFEEIPCPGLKSFKQLIKMFGRPGN